MSKPTVPWKDTAVLVCEGDGVDRRIAGEGSLFAMVHRLKIVKREAWSRYSISLPDRQQEPFRFDPPDFDDLIREHGRMRI
jgi:hypothetical protein